MKSLISITSKATSELIRMLGSANATRVLFYVEGGGCNGLKYKLEPIDGVYDLGGTDEIKLDENHYLHVCRKSSLYVIGTEIGWSDDFMGRHFKFTNPNAASKCGCGTTFSVTT